MADVSHEFAYFFIGFLNFFNFCKSKQLFVICLKPHIVTTQFPVYKTVATYQARLNYVALNWVEVEIEIEIIPIIVKLNNHHR